MKDREAPKGLRFKDLSKESVRGRLTKAQRKYLEYQERVYRYHFEDENREWYRSLPKDMRLKVRKEQYAVLTGQTYKEAQETVKENYSAGFKFGGRPDLSEKYEKLYDSLSEDDRDMLMQEMPDLWMFYKDKRGHEKRNAFVTEEGALYQQQLAEQVINSWAEEKGIDLETDNED